MTSQTHRPDPPAGKSVMDVESAQAALAASGNSPVHFVFPLEILRFSWSDDLPERLRKVAQSYGIETTGIETRKGLLHNVLRIEVTGAASRILRFHQSILRTVESANAF